MATYYSGAIAEWILETDPAETWKDLTAMFRGEGRSYVPGGWPLSRRSSGPIQRGERFSYRNSGGTEIEVVLYRWEPSYSFGFEERVGNGKDRTDFFLKSNHPGTLVEVHRRERGEAGFFEKMSGKTDTWAVGRLSFILTGRFDENGVNTPTLKIKQGYKLDQQF